ncbi:hypothetical protein BG004_002886 [Podila humilis]|nr:hypothetical protein BG004_002886 [Podila humilis]
MIFSEQPQHPSAAESVANSASIQAVHGAHYALNNLPDLHIYANYVEPVILYFERKSQESPALVRLSMRGFGVAVLTPLVSVFVFLSSANLACLCVSSLVLAVMEYMFSFSLDDSLI